MRGADLVYRQVRRHVRRRTLDLLIMDGPARSCFHSESFHSERVSAPSERAPSGEKKRDICGSKYVETDS